MFLKDILVLAFQTTQFRNCEVFGIHPKCGVTTSIVKNKLLAPLLGFSPSDVTSGKSDTQRRTQMAQGQCGICPTEEAKRTGELLSGFLSGDE